MRKTPRERRCGGCVARSESDERGRARPAAGRSSPQRDSQRPARGSRRPERVAVAEGVSLQQGPRASGPVVVMTRARYVPGEPNPARTEVCSVCCRYVPSEPNSARTEVCSVCCRYVPTDHASVHVDCDHASVHVDCPQISPLPANQPVACMKEHSTQICKEQ